MQRRSSSSFSAVLVTGALGLGAMGGVHPPAGPATGAVEPNSEPPHASVDARRPPAAEQSPDVAAAAHAFYFTRAAYTSRRSRFRGWRGRGRDDWETDWPKADRQFLTVLTRLTNLDAYPEENAVRLDDPELRRFPFLYALEVGDMRMTEAEVEGLRDYLLAGGFLVIDDFWGTREWANFEAEMRRVFPDRPILDLPLDHPLFDSFYTIDEIIQVPQVDRGRRGGPTYERDGYVPHARGIFDDDGRLMVVINWNTDLGDAWEWAELHDYPLEYSTFAFKMGVNMIVYGMSH